MPVYVKGEEIQGLVRELIEKYHPGLRANDVDVRVMVAFAKVNDKTGETQGPAVKHHGYPAYAVIRVCNLKQRVQGLGDAEITIDGDRWSDLTPEQQEALIDHELEHLEFKKDKHGGIKWDDLGRPQLKLRPHDWQLGGFENVSRRHGENAIEVKEMNAHLEARRQLFLPFGELEAV